jgi:hypothetical protein
VIPPSVGGEIEVGALSGVPISGPGDELYMAAFPSFSVEQIIRLCLFAKKKQRFVDTVVSRGRYKIFSSVEQINLSVAFEPAH